MIFFTEPRHELRCVQDVLLDLDKFVKLHLNLAGDEATEPEVKGGKKLTSEFFDVLDTMVKVAVVINLSNQKGIVLFRLKRQDSTKELEIVEFAKFVFAQLALPENKEMANKWIRYILFDQLVAILILMLGIVTDSFLCKSCATQQQLQPYPRVRP